jgi:preprotein translocase subunit SecG
MSTFVLVLIVIVAILLVVVVLAQNPKGGGLASGFGGSSATQFMGVKKTGDFLENTTWVLAVLLLTLSLTANVMRDTSDDEERRSINVEKAKSAQKSMPAPAGSEILESPTEELAPAEESAE